MKVECRKSMEQSFKSEDNSLSGTSVHIIYIIGFHIGPEYVKAFLDKYPITIQMSCLGRLMKASSSLQQGFFIIFLL